MSAHPWQRVAFTTYALSLSFFEAVILDALVRGGGSAQPLVLTDVHGVRESLSEQGAHRVGKDYDVEPVAVSGGVFHPKLTILMSGAECHVLVGSGNLTFNGWGGNCEVIEHLHPGFAPDAIADAAEFFERLPSSNRVRQGAKGQCAEIASGLRRAVQGRPRNLDVRFLHNLAIPLTDQIVLAAAELGGARRLVAAAPFWDSGVALDNLCRTLGLSEAFIHAHAKGAVEGTTAANWPQDAHTPVHAVRITPLDTPSEAGRRLHAKAFEVLCRRGRLVVSGSANGTSAALSRDGNIEGCVLRIQRKRDGWSFVPAERPVPQGLEQDSGEDELNRVGVLRAVLEQDEVIGQVLTPHMTGAVSIYHLAPVGPELLAHAVLDSEGAFSITAPDLEKGSWRGGRLVLRVTDTAGQQAEGFVSVASFAEIVRRGGPVTRQLLAVIFGTETPEDVTAILSWFLEDPHRLSPNRQVIHASVESQGDHDSEQLVPIAALRSQFAEGLATTKPSEIGERHWSRFLDQVLAAFRETRRPFAGSGVGAPGDDEDEPPGDSSKPGEPDPAIDKAYGSFSHLFEILTRNGCSPRHAEIAFDLTAFICARLRPEPGRARSWLVSVIRVWLTAGVRPERRDDVAAAILTILGTAPDTGSPRWARSSLLQLGHDLSAPPPASDVVRNYQTVLLQQECFADLWARVRKIRTYQEQVQMYVKALERGEASPTDAYPDLPVAASDAWPVLAQALKSPQARARLLFMKDVGEASCPVHYISLPKQEVDKLRTIGIAMTKNCCGRVVIRREA